MSKVRYLNRSRKENIYWAGAMKVYFEQQAQYYTKESLKWLDSIILSLDCFMQTELKDVPDEEVLATVRLGSYLTPKLVAVKDIDLGSRRVTVDENDINDFAEFALEYCNHCNHDFFDCRLRKLSISFGIPALVETGPCQYYKGM